MKSWKNFPFLRLIVPAITGIIAGILISAFHPPGVLVPVLLLIAFGIARFLGKAVSYRFRWIPGASLMIILGYYFVVISQSTMDPSGNQFIGSLGEATREYIADISEPPVQRSKSVKIIADLKAVKSGRKWIEIRRRALLYIRKDDRSQDLFYGDRILFRGKLEKPDGAMNPGDFDYRRYLALRNIFLRGYIAESQWMSLPAGKGNPLFREAMRTRDKLLEIFRANGVTGKEFAVASALLLGYVDEIDQQTLREYSATGAMHILSVSGMHVGIIFLVLDKIFSPLNRRRWGPAVKAPLIIFLIWFYAFVTGLAPAVLRASAMLSMIVLGQSFKRNPEILNILAASALMLLAWDPALIFDAGFQLSYMAVAGIVLINKPVYDLYVTSNYLLDKIWSLLAVSISAQLATFPLGFFYFHQFPNLFMITNLVVVPLSSLIIYLGIILLFLGSLPVISALLAKGLVFLVWLLNTSIHLIERIPYSVSRGVTITGPETLLIYLAMTCIIAFLIFNQKKWLLVFLSCSVLLVVLCTFDKYLRLKGKRIVVYNLGRSSALEAGQHSESIYLSWSGKAVEPSFQESLERNRLNAGITKKLSIHLCPSVADGNSFRWKNYFFKKGFFVQVHGKRIVVISRKLPREGGEPFKVDYLIVTGNPNIRMADLQKHFKPGEIVLDAENPKWKIKRWLEEAQKLNIPCYSISGSGAKVIDL